MDTILIAAALILAGDSKFRLSSRRDRSQAPTLSFTYNPNSTLVFLHLDGDFSYSRSGYYPENNSLELYLSYKHAVMLCGVLKNIVTYTSDPGHSPSIPDWKHVSSSSRPTIIEEYSVQASSITIANPLNINLRPRGPEGFITYVALTRPQATSSGLPEIAFRLKFWLTERSIPELDILQRFFRQRSDTRTRPMSFTFTFTGKELSLLQRQLEVLVDRYKQITALPVNII